MDENRLKKIVQKYVDSRFKGFTIRDFRVLPTSKLDDKGKWVPDSYTLFIGFNRPGNYYLELGKDWELGYKLEKLLGMEVVADFY